MFSTLRYAQVVGEEYYIRKYDAFYNWNIGSLKEKEILNALSIFFEANEIGEKIKKNIATSKAISLLVTTYKEKAGSTKPSQLTQEEWLAIRSHYEQRLKEENETTFGAISHNEGIDYNAKKYNKDDVEADTDFSYDDEEIEEDEEPSNLKKLESELLYLLETFYEKGWALRAVTLDSGTYEFQVAIINLQVEKPLLEKTIISLKKKYPTAQFSLKAVNQQNYIEGLFCGR